MRKQILRYLLLIAVVLTNSGVRAFAQGYFREGYFVSNKQDTTKGLIKLVGKQETPGFKFKPSEQGNEFELMADDVSAIVITDYRYFKAITLDGKKYLAQALVEGEASLFLWNENFYLEKNGKLDILNIERIEINRGDQGTVVQEKKSYIGVLKSSMSDCPAVWPSIDKLRLTESQLTDLFEKYNNCKNVNARVYKKDLPGLKVTVQPLIGFGYSRINTKNDQKSYGTYSFLRGADLNNFSISPGIGFYFSNKRANDRLSFYTELRYAKNQYYDRYVYSGVTLDDNEITLNTSQLYLPLMFKYDIIQKSGSNIYLKGGMISSFLLKGEMTINRRTSFSTPDSPPVITETDFEFYPVQFWFAGAAGYDFALGEKLRGAVELRYESTGPLINDAQIGMPQNTLSLITAISF